MRTYHWQGTQAWALGLAASVAVVVWLSMATTAQAATTPVAARGRLCNNSSQSVYATVERFDRDNDPRSPSRWILYRISPGGCTDRRNMDAEGIWGKSCSSSNCWLTLWKIAENTVTTTDANSLSTRYSRGMYFSYGWTNFGGGWRDPYGEGFSVVRPTVGSIGYSLYHKYP